MKTNKLLALLFILVSISNGNSQELPPILTFTPKQYNADNQNWNIAQDENQHIYVANNRGLLEYNGANWTMYNSPNETIIRAVEVTEDKIYTGCYMEFGFWERNNLGTLEYSSLSDKLKQPLIEDEHFWKIIAIEDWILFQSLNRIYLYNTKSEAFKIIEGHTLFTKMYAVNNVIYFQRANDGIYKIVNGIPSLVSDNPLVKENIVVHIFEHLNEPVFVTQNEGLYKFSNNELIPWEVVDSVDLTGVSVYSCIQLRDKSLMLGTISNGIIHISANGELLESINQEDGLNNNTVLDLFEDEIGNVWLALDNGINCVNVKSAFSIYNDDKGKVGTVYASAVFNEHLYIGTNQGLFYKPLQDTNSKFQIIDGTKGQVWTLDVLDDTLFCGHNLGTFTVDLDVVTKISNVEGTWSLKPAQNNPNLILQGNYNGLNVLEKVDGNWSYRNKIEGFDHSSRYFEEFADVCFVNHEYKGIYKLKINSDYTQVVEVNEDESIEKGLNSSIIKFNSELLYMNKKGVYSYNFDSEKFEKNQRLSDVFLSETYSSGKLISNDIDNTLWGFSEKSITYLSPGILTDAHKVNRISLPRNLREEMVGYENITFLGPDTYLYGTSLGYIIINLKKIKTKSYTVSIQQVENFSLQDGPDLVGFENGQEFDSKHNNFNFLFSVPEYEQLFEPEYRYRLDGYTSRWSSWSADPTAVYENLPSGNFEFLVQAKIDSDTVTDMASFNFTIDSPWYLSKTMIVFYVVIVILFSIFMHNVYKVYYKRQKEKLVESNKRELEVLELESKQRLMHIENEKLQQDIENKNRELAISTMSLIKKNEFLHNIKEELKDVSTEAKIKPVIKIIDKNLNNTDDWKFFEEAFNNADKDFLKKVKHKHPSLTPNDLKLCAYLRLNLSSKEIAPLLNISPRSVEVKRYRLRKKMELEHEVSLTNYILEI
ncbi:MAG: hypothetical protein BM564_02795 [Bacteroidetes bacterium MedPE-SWsnd-G2]|nr:MAG: hypothetical protein BM564_02795 [Bacteroidetes bacterium MedPE-SWsnd-G2]